jgi:hypothetical protein
MYAAAGQKPIGSKLPLRVRARREQRREGTSLHFDFHG